MSMNTPRIFNQLSPSDTGIMNLLYTVATNTRAQVTLFVCNRDADAEFFRIALVPSGGTLINASYIAYDSILAPHGVFSVSGIGMNVGDAIYVKSARGYLSFTATGIQLS